MLEPAATKRFTRELNAMLNRAADEDPEGFAVIVGLLDDARARLSSSAEKMREAGYSWQDIARPLGVTRSAAYQRFGSTGARAQAASADVDRLAISMFEELDDAAASTVISDALAEQDAIRAERWSA